MRRPRKANERSGPIRLTIAIAVVGSFVFAALATLHLLGSDRPFPLSFDDHGISAYRGWITRYDRFDGSWETAFVAVELLPLWPLEVLSGMACRWRR
jgi:hypothetical protein